jgi:hypothetical protein
LKLEVWFRLIGIIHGTQKLLRKGANMLLNTIWRKKQGRTSIGKRGAFMRERASKGEDSSGQG